MKEIRKKELGKGIKRCRRMRGSSVRKVKLIKKGTCLKEKVEMSGRALGPQKSLELCRRREESGKYPQKVRELGERRGRFSRKSWGR